MRTRYTAILTFGLLLALFPARELLAEGQTGQDAFAEIVFVDGDDLTVIRAGGKLEVIDQIGARLYVGDQVQTGAKTQVELVAMPRKSRLRLSENTIVTIRKMGSDGATDLELVYGRLRSKVEKLATRDSPYRVGSRSFVAGVRGTDFGCDIIVAKPGEPAQDRVYCFEGSVEVRATQVETAAQAPSSSQGTTPAEAQAMPRADESAPPVLVTAGTMALIVAPIGGKPAKLTQVPLEKEIRAFWKANDFSSAMPSAVAPAAAAASVVAGGSSASAAAPAPVDAVEPALVQPPVPQIDLRPIRRKIAAKSAFAVGGAMMATIGLGIQGYSFYLRSENNALSDQFLLAGGATALFGLPFIFYSLSVDPMRGYESR